MWSLGGLSARELVKRTARQTWQDDIFGQAARLAFYHFLAIFPVLLLLLIPLAHRQPPAQICAVCLPGRSVSFYLRTPHLSSPMPSRT